MFCTLLANTFRQSLRLYKIVLKPPRVAGGGNELELVI